MDRSIRSPLGRGAQQCHEVLQDVLSQLRARQKVEAGAQRTQLTELCRNLAEVVDNLQAASTSGPDDASLPLAKAYDLLSAALGQMQGMPGSAEEQRRCAQALALLFASGASRKSSAPPRRPSSTQMRAVKMPAQESRTISSPTIDAAELDEAELAALDAYLDSPPSSRSPASRHAGLPAPPGPDRRSSNRVAFEVEVGFVSETHFYAGISMDVSTGGLFIATYQLQPVGSSVLVTFALPNGHTVTTNAVVRWVREGGDDISPGFGVSLELTGEDARQVRLFCARRQPLFIDMD